MMLRSEIQDEFEVLVLIKKRCRTVYESFFLLASCYLITTCSYGSGNICSAASTGVFSSPCICDASLLQATNTGSKPLPQLLTCDVAWFFDLVANALSVVVSTVAATSITANAATTARYFVFILLLIPTNGLFIWIKLVEYATLIRFIIYSLYLKVSLSPS
jgi:hypothetical protein